MFTVCLGGLGLLALVGGMIVSVLDNEPAGTLAALIGAGLIALVVLFDTGTWKSDICCEYASVTTARVNAACRDRGGVAKWGGGQDYVCKDGYAGWLRTGYYRAGEEPRP